jgi:hypothetical protein
LLALRIRHTSMHLIDWGPNFIRSNFLKVYLVYQKM